MTPVREALEPQYQQFRRTAIAEMTPWVEGFDMSRVSVSAPDKEAGSPKTGDMIARNPKNHDDKWLVAAAYFADNFAAASAPSGAHFTDADLDALFEASKRDAHFVGSEIRQLIGDIRTARASAAPGEPCAPIGYAYQYPDALRFATGGREINGSKPTKVIPLYTTPQPASGWDEAIRSAMDAIEKMRVAGACNFTDARHQGQRGVDYTDTLYDAYQVVKALRREAPAPAEGVTSAELIAALRTFPHFEGDTPVTPDAICAVAKEYIDMVMTWEPQRAALEFLDHEGNKHWLVYEAGDGDLAGGWTLRDDSNLATRPDTAEARLREALAPFAKMAAAMYVSGHCGGASPEDWPNKWFVTISGGEDFHAPQQHGGYLTVADFRRAQQALSPLSGGDDSEMERLRDALSLALQYIPAQPTDSDAAKDIERIHDLIAGRARAWDERPSGGDEAKESEGRCEICDWPYAKDRSQGCVPGDCSYRPADPVEQERIRKRREELKASLPSEPSPPADRREIVATKPHKGRITDWLALPCQGGLGYYIIGTFLEHPDFGSKETNTSYVVKHDKATGEIETRNSRYTLIAALDGGR